MVTTEILQSLGYSSLREYFEQLYALGMEDDEHDAADAMFDALSEQQQAEYEMFTTDYYYEYHDNKNSEQSLVLPQMYSSKIVKVHEYEVCFYWPDANGCEWIRDIYEWHLGSAYRRRFIVESEQEAESLGDAYLNIYIK